MKPRPDIATQSIECTNKKSIYVIPHKRSKHVPTIEEVEDEEEAKGRNKEKAKEGSIIEEITLGSIGPIKRETTITAKVTTSDKRTAELKALLDCGCTHTCISKHLVKEEGIPTLKLN